MLAPKAKAILQSVFLFSGRGRARDGWIHSTCWLTPHIYISTLRILNTDPKIYISTTSTKYLPHILTTRVLNNRYWPCLFPPRILNSLNVSFWILDQPRDTSASKITTWNIFDPVLRGKETYDLVLNSAVTFGEHTYPAAHCSVTRIVYLGLKEAQTLHKLGST